MNKILKFGLGFGLAGISLVVFFVLSLPAKAATTVEPHDPTVLQSGYAEGQTSSYSYPDATSSGLSYTIPSNAVVVEIGYGSDDHDYFVQASQGRFTQTSPGIWGVASSGVQTNASGSERRGVVVSLNPPANSYLSQWGWSSSHTSGGQGENNDFPANVCVHVKYRLFDSVSHALLSDEGEAGNCSQNSYSVPYGLRGFIRADEGSFITGISHFQIGNDAKTRGGVMVYRTLASSSLGARYNSDTLPVSSDVGVQKEGAINMRNDGSTPWSSDQIISQTQNCPNFYDYDPNSTPSNPSEICTDYRTVRSSNYLLKRIDTENSVNTQGEEFPYRMEVTTQHRWESYCDEYSGDGGPIIVPPVTQQNRGNIFSKIAFFFENMLFNNSLASIIGPGGTGECLRYVWSDAATESASSIYTGAIANFPAVHYTGNAPGTFNLKFQMIDKSRNLQFGDVVIIPVTITGPPLPLDATLSATSPVSVGQNTTLDWDSTNADSCTQFVTSPGGTPIQLPSPPFGTRKGIADYTITEAGIYIFINHCVSTTATPSVRDAIATVIGNSVPVNLDATITSSPNIRHGENSIVNWDSSNPAIGTTCRQYYTTPTDPTTEIPIATTLSGTRSVGPLSGPGTYVFYNKCSNINASPPEKTASANTVVAGPLPLLCTLSANPPSPIENNSSTAVNWSAPNALQVKLFPENGYRSGNWDTNPVATGGEFGTFNTPLLASSTRYLCQATNPNTSPASADTIIDIEVNPPTTNLSATLTATSPVNVGKTTTLTWDSNHADACQVYREQTYGALDWTPIDGFGPATSGSQPYPPGGFTTAGSYRFKNHCTGTKTTPASVDSLFVTVVVNAMLPLDATIRVTTPIAHKTSTIVTWDSLSAPPGTTCSQYEEQVYLSGDWGVPFSNTLSGTATRPPSGGYAGPSDHRFMNQCNNPDTSPTVKIATATAHVNGEAVPLPLDATLSATSPVSVGQTTILDWDSTNARDCQVYVEQGINNWVPIAGFGPATSGSQPYPDGGFTTAGNYRFMNQCSGKNTTPASMNSLIVTVVVKDATPPPPPPPPTKVSIDVSSCEQAVVTWAAPRGAPLAVTGYNIYRSTDGSSWGSSIANVSSSTFSYTDRPPLGNYYYGVTALNGAAESTKATAGPANVRPCKPDLSTSDKDITKVSPIDITSKPQPCNAASDPVILTGNKSFKVGDVVTFKINICNTGDATGNGILKNVRVIDSLSNLSAPGNYSYPGCSSGSASVSGSTITFSVGDIPGGKTCSVSFTAKVTKPPTGAIYRFQNIADITPTNWPVKRVVTPAYLFTDSSGNPDRNEISP